MTRPSPEEEEDDDDYAAAMSREEGGQVTVPARMLALPPVRSRRPVDTSRRNTTTFPAPCPNTAPAIESDSQSIATGPIIQTITGVLK